MTQDLKRTPLHETHTSLKARMMPFAGWDMPVQYRSILEESRAVRSKAGIFDVSHMGRLYLSGPRVELLMDWILTGDATSLFPGRARYAMICNENGGIIDDTVYYRRGEHAYLLVCNAGNRSQVVPWIRRWAQERYPETFIEDQTEATAMIALQGPLTPEILNTLCDATPSDIRPFSAIQANVASRPAFIGRTGYTGEDGFELIVPAADSPHIWQALMDLGAAPCGLGARDVLRLEAGLALHGHDIDNTTNPLEAGLERFVRLDKESIGVEALRRHKEAGLKRRLTGLIVEGRSIAREGYPILSQETNVGRVTSGTFSPTLDRVIAMGYVLTEFMSPGQALQIDIRGKLAAAEIVSLPFYSRKVTK